MVVHFSGLCEYFVPTLKNVSGTKYISLHILKCAKTETLSGVWVKVEIDSSLNLTFGVSHHCFSILEHTPQPVYNYLFIYLLSLLYKDKLNYCIISMQVSSSHS